MYRLLVKNSLQRVHMAVLIHMWTRLWMLTGAKSLTSLKVDIIPADAISELQAFNLLLLQILQSARITGSYDVSEIYKGPDGFSNQILSGAMLIVMGILTMVRVGRNMTRKIVDADINNCSGKMHQRQLPASPVSAVEYSCALRHLGELEEKVTVLSNKQTEMPLEKEEMLNAAVKRMDALEAEFAATKVSA